MTVRTQTFMKQVAFTGCSNLPMIGKAGYFFAGRDSGFGCAVFWIFCGLRTPYEPLWIFPLLDLRSPLPIVENFNVPRKYRQLIDYLQNVFYS